MVGKIPYPCQSFYGAPTEIWEWISNFILLYICIQLLILACWYQSYSLLVKGVPGNIWEGYVVFKSFIQRTIQQNLMMHLKILCTLFVLCEVLLCYVIHQFYLYFSGLFYYYWGNHMINPGLILSLCPANKRRCHFVTTFLIGWVQA